MRQNLEGVSRRLIFVLYRHCLEGLGETTKIRRAVGGGRAGRPDHDQQYCYHHAPAVKPEAATAVELLMMGVRMPETR
jgi:hypothetical protein